MIYHVVMWRLKDEALGRPRADNALLLKAALERLRGAIPGLSVLTVGIDTRRRQNSADLVMISRFDSQEALEEYHRHPLHEELKPFASAVRTESIVVDFADD